MKRPFHRSGSAITATLSRRERDLLKQLPALLEAVGTDGAADPAAERLNPPAYRDDPVAAAEYRDLIGDEMDQARREDRDRFVAALDRRTVELSEEEADAWLRVLGEARLVVAARMGIVEDYDWSDPRLSAGPDGAVLQYLSYLQDGLVGALSAGL